MPDLAEQIRAYLDDTAPPVTFDDIFAERFRVAPAEQPPARLECSLVPDSPLGGEDHVVVDDLHQRPRERDVRAEPRRWVSALVAVAATSLVLVGLVFDGNRDSGDVVSDPVVSPGPARSVAPLDEVESVPSPGRVDPVRYRWSRVSDDAAVFDGAQWMQSVAVGGPGLVAVGSVGNNRDADAAVWTSDDGTTWSRVPHDETVFGGPRGQWMSSVAAGGPGVVAVGWDGRFSDSATPGEWMEWGEESGAAAVWTSVDGITWARVPHDATVFGADRSSRMNGVTVGGPGLVAVGSVENDGRQVAAVWTSVDGITWSRVPHDEAAFGGSGTTESPQLWQEMISVTVGGPGLVAVGGHSGTDAAVWTSVDGLTWSRVPHDEAVFGPRGLQGMSSVVAGGPGFVAVGFEQVGDDTTSGRARDAAVWTSPDGITWSRIPHDAEVFGGIGHQRMHSVAVTGGGLVAVGADGGWYDTHPVAAVWTSVDGITWSKVPDGEAVFGEGEMRSVTVAGAGLVVVGAGDPDRGGAVDSGDSLLVWVAEPED